MRTPKWKTDGSNPLNKLPCYGNIFTERKRAYKNIRGIDGERPTNEQMKFLYTQPCIKCGRAFEFNKRSIFVQAGNKLMWWHGLMPDYHPLFYC